MYDTDDESILLEAFDLCKQYEFIFSRTQPESELYQLNAGTLPLSDGSYTISDDLSGLIERGLYYSSLSNGAFDITIEPISSLWDFQSDSPSLPNDDLIQQKLPLVDYTNVTLHKNLLHFEKEAMGIDLGAIAKGYIADRLKEFLLSKNVNSAIISLGGNVLCVGAKPDGSPFQIGIQKPYADRNETIALLELTDVSVVSSGVYERYFELDGKNYHHILNPKTGYPYDNGLISVTIISSASVDGDALSTTAFALGLEEGMKLIDSMDNVYAVFITSDETLHYSANFTEQISVTEIYS